MLFIAGASQIFNSCDLAKDLIGNESVAKLEGEWSCEENSDYFKKSATSVYSVYISADVENDNGILLDNFYNLGDLGVRAHVTGLVITIPSQPMEGGYQILTGSGSVSANYNQITFSYNINIGGDAVDTVTAVYTKLK